MAARRLPGAPVQVFLYQADSGVGPHEVRELRKAGIVPVCCFDLSRVRLLSVVPFPVDSGALARAAVRRIAEHSCSSLHTAFCKDMARLIESAADDVVDGEVRRG